MIGQWTPYMYPLKTSVGLATQQCIKAGQKVYLRLSNRSKLKDRHDMHIALNKRRQTRYYVHMRVQNIYTRLGDTPCMYTHAQCTMHAQGRWCARKGTRGRTRTVDGCNRCCMLPDPSRTVNNSWWHACALHAFVVVTKNNHAHLHCLCTFCCIRN